MNDDFDDQDLDVDDEGDVAEDPVRVSRKQARFERERAEEDDFWRQALATKVGRRAIYRVFEQGGLWTNPFAVGPNGFPQPDATWFKAGEKALIVRIHDKFQILDHEAVFTMLCENDSRYKKARRA